MYQNPQLRASPQLEEDILIMLEGISGDIIKYPRASERFFFVCVSCAEFIFCLCGRLAGSNLQTFELNLRIH